MPARAAPRPYHHGDLRAALLAAGRQILEEGGPRALSFREAARRVGVSHAAPGHHFGSLQAYLGDCAASGFDQFTTELLQAASTQTDAVERLCAMARAYVRFARQHRAVFRLMFDRDSFGERTEALAMSGACAYGVLVEAVRALGPLPDAAELDHRIDAVWSVVHGVAALALENQVCRRAPAGAGAAADDDAPLQLAASTLRTFLAGLGLQTQRASVRRRR
jgi:AcrR family transcriptional regulator